MALGSGPGGAAGRGVSPAVAALLLTLIAAVAAALAYVWIAGYMGSLAPRGGLRPLEVLKIDAVGYDGATLTLYVANVGEADATVVSAYVLAEDRTAVCSWSGSVTLPRGSVGALSLSGCYLEPGRAYTALVSTSRGVEATYRMGLPAGAPTSPPQAPLFRIAGYNDTVYGPPGGSARLVVEVANVGAAEGTAYVEVRDHSGTPVARSWARVQPNSAVQAALSVDLPPTKGAWTWTLKVLNGATNAYDDQRSFAVHVAEFDLRLVSRTALILESFEALPSGWSPLGGKWSIVPEGWLGSALRGGDDDKGPGAAAAYYYAAGPIQPGFQAVVKLGAAKRNDRVYKGYILLAEPAPHSSFYEVSIYPWGRFVHLAIYYRHQGGRRELSRARAGYVSEWYTLYLAYTYEAPLNRFTATLYDREGNAIASVTDSDSAARPSYLGLGVD